VADRGYAGEDRGVLELKSPDARYRKSYLAAMADFTAEGRGNEDDRDSALGRQIAEFGPTWQTETGFAGFVEALRAAGDPAVPPPPGWVHSSTFWLVDGAQFLGEIRIRHRLTPHLLKIGGHIGYDVAPAARLRGHGTTLLRLALAQAADLGIDQALITCDNDNVGSRKIIEANGGVFEDEREGKLRYWVATATSDDRVESLSRP
jgi:predicted acetyltransferase